MNPKPFQVLIVDEDRELCHALTELLVEAGCRVECLSPRAGYWQAIRQLVPDLVILDIAADETHGLDAMRRLGSRRAPRMIPIIATSHRAELEYELLDLFDFLVKPIDKRRLLEDVTLLRQQKQQHGPPGYPPMEEESLALFQEYLITHSGLHFDQRNLKILERGLQRRMHAVEAHDYLDYHRYLERFADSRQELKKLLGLLTVGETYFFRYLAHYEALAQSVLPGLLGQPGRERTLRIWSAGCSTGEEPYSLAMLLLEHFPQLDCQQIQILGTDINKGSLRRAQEGVYGPRALRVTEPRYREKYFRQVGSSYILDPRVREMVRFSYLNLQTGAFPFAENGTAGIDILFCRNVMIYFRLATTRRMVDRFADCLRPGGYLFLGHAETLSGISDRFQRHQQGGGFYYQLRAEGEHPAATPADSLAPPPLRMPAPAIPPPAPARPAPAPIQTPRRVQAPPSEPAPDLAELFLRAEQEFNRENFKTASQIYATILRHDPRHVGALVGQGFIQANEGVYEAALETAGVALGIDDLRPEAYFLRGLILELQDDLPGAADEYRKALLLDLDFIMPHYNLSKVYGRLGRQRDARRELNNTVRLLERSVDETLIPYSGGLSRAVFLEVCREDTGQGGAHA